MSFKKLIKFQFLNLPDGTVWDHPLQVRAAPKPAQPQHKRPGRATWVCGPYKRNGTAL